MPGATIILRPGGGLIIAEGLAFAVNVKRTSHDFVGASFYGYDCKN